MLYQNYINLPTAPFSMGFVGLVVVLAIWDLAWKGYGMWKAARNDESEWFLAILIFNTIGILPILYIYVFSKDKK